jgi:hypothetical protein
MRTLRSVSLSAIDEDRREQASPFVIDGAEKEKRALLPVQE